MIRHKVTVYFYGALIPASDGSHARACTLLDRLNSTSHKIAVFSYDNHPEFPWTPSNIAAFERRWPRIELVLDPYTAKLKFVTRIKNLLISLFPAAADRLLKVSIRGWSPGFERLKATSQCIIVNYAHGLSQLNGLTGETCFVDTHDLNFVKWAKIVNASTVSVTALRKLRGEIAALQITDAVIAISSPEAAFFRTMFTEDKIFYVASWDEPRAPAPCADRPPQTFDLVFFGSQYIMNSRGLCGMFETHGHWLSRYRIAVCGLVCNDPDVVSLARRFPNVSLLGFIDSPADIYKQSKAALAPVDGTGLKMKILAAMEAGVPAFASRQALDGLPPGHMDAIFPITESNVASLLADEQRLTEARDAARRYYTIFNETGEATAVLDRLTARMSDAISPDQPQAMVGPAAPHRRRFVSATNESGITVLNAD